MTTSIIDTPPRSRADRIAEIQPALLLVLSVLGFSLVPLFARPLMDGGLPAELVALIRFLPGLILGCHLLPRLIANQRKRGPAVAFFGAGAAIGASWALYLEGLSSVPVAVAGTVYMSYPLFVVLFAWLFLRRRPSGRALAASLLVILGAAMLVGAAQNGEDLQMGWTLLLCLPAPVSFAVIVLMLVRDFGRLSVLEKFAAAMSGTVASLVALILYQTPLDQIASLALLWDAEMLLLMGGLALLTATIPQMVYSAMAKRLPEARVATLGALELPFMVAIGWLAFGEALGIWGVAATVLIFAAIATVPQER